MLQCTGWHQIRDARGNLFNIECQVTFMPSCILRPKFYCVYIMFTGMCLEKRVFYRAISGLHSSINIHLCSKFLLSGMCNYTMAQLFLHECMSNTCCMKQVDVAWSCEGGDNN